MKKITAAFSWLIKPFSVEYVIKERVSRELMALRTEADNMDWKAGSKREEVYAALQKAQHSANKCDFESAWGHFYEADQLLVKSMDDTQRNIRGKLLLIESEKFTSKWRQKQIILLLGDTSKELYPISPNEIFKANAVRNDYYLTVNHKMNLHKVNANILTLLMIIILTGILIICFSWNITDLKLAEPDGQTPQGPGVLWKILIVCGVFGAFGAGFSYARTLFSYSPELSKIPDQLLSMTITLFRFIIGASAAIIIFLLFESRFLNEQFSKAILQSPVTYIVFSFVAGFSERWVVQMIGLVTKEKEQNSEKAK